nr:restriction endonuclease subunit S [Streptomyces sp. SID4982]
MEQVFRRGLLGKNQVDSLLGLIPEGWVVEELGNSHSVQTGGTPSRRNPQYWEGGTIPWVKTAEVSYSTITETSEHITAIALEETNVKLFPAGTLLLAMYGQGVTRGKVGKLGIRATCNQACAAIQCPDGIVDSDYLYYFLEWQYENIRARAHGGQQQNLNLDIVRKIPIAYPRDPDEQKEIVSLFKAIDQKVELHQARLDRLRELYQRVLLAIMTGEVSPDDVVHAARTSEGNAA